MSDELRRATLAVHAGRGTRAEGDPLNPPLIPAAPFRGDRYARNEGTPAWEAFEEAVGALEGGIAVAFASGMGAIAVVLEELPPGARIVVPADGYTGTRALLGAREAAGKAQVSRVDIADTGAVLSACAGADLLWVEMPANPTLAIAELDALCEGAHQAGALVAVDSTLATPLLLRPLEHGADIVVHSATKFIGGHSDLLMGVAVTHDQALAEHLREGRRLLGTTPGALEIYLALRGLRTLSVRLDRGQASAHTLAERLAAHSQVTRVRYPGLPDDPGHERAARLMDGFGAVFSFEVAGGAARADRVCARVEVLTNATSLGGVETLIERRARYPLELVPESLMRVSVGCEDVEDLWQDLERALAS
ncbi:MAG: PLP-dependent transferase [Solirubrobacteraceae bacterium]